MDPSQQTTPSVSQFPSQAPTSLTLENPGKNFGIVSLVLSIVGVHLIGLIFGILGLKKSQSAGQKNGLALAGIIISAIGLVATTIAAIFIITGLTIIAAECSARGPGSHFVNGTAISCS